MSSADRPRLDVPPGDASTEDRNQVLARPAIASAERAWRRNDFATVDRALSPHADILDRRLRRRLEYARRHLRRAGAETSGT